MSTDWLIQDLLPRRELNLVAGPSGAGKTTFILDLLYHQWSKGANVFGYESFPDDWAYVSLDRSSAGNRRTFARLGIPYDAFPIVSGLEEGLTSVEAIIKRVKDAWPETKLIVVEGVGYLIPGGRVNDGPTAFKFYTHVTKLCQQYDVAILGVMHTSKAKSDSFYTNPRERIAGSGAIAGCAETVIIVEPLEADNPEVKLRRLYLCCRNAADRVFKMKLDAQGLLVPLVDTTVKDVEATTYAKLRAFIYSLVPGEIVSKIELERMSGAKGWQATRVMRQAIDTGLFRKLDDASWMRAQASNEKRGTAHVIE
ncbi:MAG: AAA family ATPase [Patescibacteria group bacterium]|nr:AAA family ATPase [Patescibacteria group bacterium]